MSDPAAPSSTEDALRHQHRMEDLVHALFCGEVNYLCECLAKNDRVDGEPLELITRLLYGDLKLKPHFSKRLKFARWPRQKFTLTAALKPAKGPKLLLDALASADETVLSAAIGELGILKGEGLKTFERLLRGDQQLRTLSKRRLTFGGWGQGRPAHDSSFKTAKDAVLCWKIEHRTEKGEQIKAIIADLMDETGLARSTLYAIWGAWKKKRRHAY
jgi:hypothetical protein